MQTENRSEPFLSICIPTYNRSNCLAACLESIVSQLPLGQPIEICISDNASTDNTQEIAERYARLYPFIVYRRNYVNVGVDRNIYEVPRLANGKFVKLQGDDDYFRPGTLAPLLQALLQNQDCSLLHINTRSGDLGIHRGEGLSPYLRMTSMNATFITSFVFCRNDWLTLNLSDRFIETRFHQVYLQYSLLEQNPRFCILNCSMFNHAGMPAAETVDVGMAFIEGYQSILRSFIGKGLSQEDYDHERKVSLFQVLIPGVRVLAQRNDFKHLVDFKATYIRNYINEPYYEEGLVLINAILPEQ